MKKPKKFGAGGALAGLAGLGALAYMASKKGDKDADKGETYIDKQLKRAKDMPDAEEAPAKGIASDFKSSESKFERNDNETSIPDKAPAKKSSGSTSKPASKSSSMDSGIPKKESSYDDVVSSKDLGSQSFTPPKSTSKSEPKKEAPTESKKEDKKYGIGPYGAFAGVHKALSGDTEEKPKKPYRGLDGKMHNLRKGGAVKKMAKGGMAKSASSRGDGCAMRGKTKGKIY